MSLQEVLICDAVRTPHGSFMGAFKDVSAAKLGSFVIEALIDKSPTVAEAIDGVFMGQVLTAGEGQNPARHAALKGGVSQGRPAETFNKVCASSLAALRHASNMIAVGEVSCMVAGGMESMSRAPHLVRRRAKGAFGDIRIAELCLKNDMSGEDMAIDSMLHDGLTEPTDPHRAHMGTLADMCARVHGISREAQELFAYESQSRAWHRQTQNCPFDFVIPVDLPNGETLFVDQGVRRPDRDKMKTLSPAFSADGTVTAATSSQIADGASALLIANEKTAAAHAWQPLARIVAFATYSGEPALYTTAPVGAIEAALQKSGYKIYDIDLFEINEAFAVVPLYAMKVLGIRREKVNVWGGAIAVGHPLGASGTRIVATLAHQLWALNKKRGIAVACNGGGEAVAALIERV